MAEAEAIRRAIESGARWASVMRCERVHDPLSDTNVWEVVLTTRVPTR